jgi:colicin import membrane protein
MTSSEHKDLFLPPVSEPSARAFVLALGVHLLLLVALTRGIPWHQQAELESSTAELWSNIPNLTLQAPPPAVVTPEPEPEPTPQTKPEPPPKPTPMAKPPAPALSQAELGIEKLKKDKILQEEKKAVEKKALKEKLEKEKLEKEKIEKAKIEKAKEKEKAKELTKQTAKDAEKKRAQEAKDQERRVQENLNFVQSKTPGMSTESARSTNLSNGQGTGSSLNPNYAGKLQDFFKSFTSQKKPYPEKPVCIVNVQTFDGKISSWTFEKHSGNPDWDKDVEDTLTRIKSQSKPLPRPDTGPVPSLISVTFEPPN